MKAGERPLGESSRARDYEWIEAYIGPRASAEPGPGYPGSVGVIVESDFVRTVLYTMLLGGLASLMAFISIGVAAGRGRSIIQLTAALATFLACGAAAFRRRTLLRFVLALGSLCTLALLVDQLVYYRWHERAVRLATILQQGFESEEAVFPVPVRLHATSLSFDTDQDILLTFEPPLLAWTYHLDSASPLGHALIAGWHRILSRVTRGRDLDGIARTIVQPHKAYAVGLTSDERTLACHAEGKGDWSLLKAIRASRAPTASGRTSRDSAAR